MSAIIYGLYDPRDADSTVRYVGQTTNPDKRLNEHIYAARNPKCRTIPNYCWIGKLLDEGVKPQMVVLETVSIDGSFDTLHQAEIAWIGRLRSGSRPLLNLAEGGEGRRGPLSEVTKQRMSAVRKGVPKSAATRAKMSAWQKGRKLPPRTPEWCAAHSAKMTGKKHSEETKAKIGASHLGKIQPKVAEFAKKRPRAANGTFL